MKKRSTIGRENLQDPITSHLTGHAATLDPERTVAQTLLDLRTQQLPDSILYFYAVDAEGRLRGVVPTRRLLTSPLDARVADLLIEKVVTIPATATVEVACEFFVMHKFLAFPVVDADGKLLGVVDVGLFTDEVIDLAEKQSLDDVFQLVGVHLTASKASPVASFKDRFPWLLCNIGGGMACAVLSGFYEALLAAQVVLALFVPVVLALAESVSMQSATITIHGLHGERVNWRGLLRNLRQEFLAAVLLGLACGGTVGAVVQVWKGTGAVALAVGGSICLAMITACMLGVLLPTAVRGLRGDPRIAAGPIVLATTDMATLLFYFNVAGLLLARG
ncbi:MAG: magnesium transporter [Planctomycetes bacterium]|nr:magnesium transporter [Planctomycetota bacterium]